MPLTEALIASQTTMPVLGVCTVEQATSCSCITEAADLWEEYTHRLSVIARGIEHLGGKVVAVRANKLFFEANVMIEGAAHFLSEADFQAAIEDTPDVSLDVDDEEDDVEGYEVDGADWAHVQALGRGEQPDLDHDTAKWLKEVGLVQQTSEGWGLTQFGKDWLETSVDS